VDWRHRIGLAFWVPGQKEHHRRWSFQEELIQFQRKHGVEYDQRYIWT
jgi:putative transposase